MVFLFIFFHFGNAIIRRFQAYMQVHRRKHPFFKSRDFKTCKLGENSTSKSLREHNISFTYGSRVIQIKNKWESFFHLFIIIIITISTHWKFPLNIYKIFTIFQLKNVSLYYKRYVLVWKDFHLGEEKIMFQYILVQKTDFM